MSIDTYMWHVNMTAATATASTGSWRYGTIDLGKDLEA